MLSIQVGNGNSTTGYLVVDSITALLGPLLSAASSQGHALMTNLMRQLRTIAQVHSITVIVRSLHQEGLWFIGRSPFAFLAGH